MRDDQPILLLVYLVYQTLTLIYLTCYAAPHILTLASLQYRKKETRPVNAHTASMSYPDLDAMLFELSEARREMGEAAMKDSTSSGFRVGEPTNAPVPWRVRDGRWTDLVARVKALDSGLVLPLEFDDPASAHAFYNGRSSWFRRRGIRIQRRGTTVYLSKLAP